MGKVIAAMTMSLDGYINDRDGSLERLYPDLDALRQTDYVRDSIAFTGAVVMGRHAYDMGEGTQEEFEDYEYQVPIFVLTHEPPHKPQRGENGMLTFTFVSDGIECAISQAKAVAGARDVLVVGGADTMRQVITTGLFNELVVLIAPVLLGSGIRLFELTGEADLELVSTQELDSLGVVVVKYHPKAVAESTDEESG